MVYVKYFYRFLKITNLNPWKDSTSLKSSFSRLDYCVNAWHYIFIQVLQKAESSHTCISHEGNFQFWLEIKSKFRRNSILRVMRVTQHFLTIFMTFFGFCVGVVKHTVKMWKDTREAVLVSDRKLIWCFVWDTTTAAISKSLRDIRTKQAFFILSLSRLWTSRTFNLMTISARSGFLYLVNFSGFLLHVHSHLCFITDNFKHPEQP